MFAQDLKRYGVKKRNLVKARFSGHTIIAVMNYRIAAWFVRHHIKLLPDMIKFRTMRRYGCEISPYCKIGGGFMILHTLGIVIGWDVIAGENLELFQNVTIGANRKEKDGRTMPTLGDNVSIGTGATVVGPIVIGNNVTIGAHSYVDKDIPDNSFVIGTPAQIIRK